MGFLLRRDLWRRGLVTEGMEAIIPDLFAATDLSVLTADMDPLDAAILGLLKRLEFREAGSATATFLMGGRRADSVYLALPRRAA